MDLAGLDPRNRRHQLLGYRVEWAKDGRAQLEWTPGEAVANPVGLVHGGFVGLLVDDCCGCAAVSLIPEMAWFPTATMHVDFLRPIPIGTSYRCEGEVLRQGRRLTVADTRVYDGDDRLMVRGTCTFALKHSSPG